MELNIAVLPGDGIGPEIIEEGLKVTKAVAEKFGHKLNYEYGLCGADAIEKTGSPYPEKTHELCMKSNAVLFGAVGDPKYDNNPKATVRPEQGLLAMRKRLGLYANIRPVTTYHSLIYKSPLRPEVLDNANFVVIRELTGGLYFGRPQGRSEDGSVAYDTCIYTHEEVERIIRLAYGYARKRKRKLTIVDKANILATSRLWREVATQLQPNFRDVKTEFMFVDNAAQRIIQDPSSFDVVVTENMFGDILTDEASVITGSMGLLPSASMGLHTSVFEPIHGSWPEAAGKQVANPVATILSVAMMFDYAFGLTKEADLIRSAVKTSIDASVRTPDIQVDGIASYSTKEVGDWITNYIKDMHI